MKKNLLFIFLLIIFIIPLQVKGEELYVNYGEYSYSDTYVEEQKDLEVETIIEDGKTIYKYRTRNYLIIPKNLVIRSRDFNIFDYIDTNLPLEEIEVTEYYDLKTMNNCNGAIEVKYKKATLGMLLYINIENYMEVPEEIFVTDYEFDIWNYIDTDIEKKEDIKFIGEYDLNNNSEYELLITYNDISKKTKIIVNIEENDVLEEDEDVVIDNEDIVIEEEINSDNYQNEEVIEQMTESKETITYISNYYEIKEPNREVEYVDRIVPVNNKVNCKERDYDKNFRYISYAFYGVTIILLSIIVVRKK